MKIGRLRHRLELQEQQEIQDPNTGAITKEWVALREVWASVEGNIKAILPNNNRSHRFNV